MVFYKRSYLFFALFLCSFGAIAQSTPIGYWKSLLAYNSAIGVATDGNTLFAISNQSFFTYNNATGDLQTFSKIEGMSDVVMQCVGYDPISGNAVLVYNNGNIDLFKDDIFYNIPDLKQRAVAGTKAVYDVYIENGFAYLSTSLGIIVVDMLHRNISEVYQFITPASQTISISSYAGAGTYFYAATSAGLFRAPKNSPELQNFQIWQKIDSTHNITKLAIVDSYLFLSNSNSVYTFMHDTLSKVYATSNKVAAIDPGYGKLFIGEQYLGRGRVVVMDMAARRIDSFKTPDSVGQVLQLMDSSIWVANVNSGLSKKRDSVNEDYFTPQGPIDPNSYDIYANNGDVWIVHGGYTDNYNSVYNSNYFTHYNNGKFTGYKYGTFSPAIDTIGTFVSITKDEQDGTIYAGSFGAGLLSFKPDDPASIHIYKQAELEPNVNNGNSGYYVPGIAADNDDNMWFTMFGSYHELYVKEKTTGNLYRYNVNLPRGYPYAGGPLVFDDAGHAWYASLKGDGAIVYNTNGTLSNAADDKYYQLQAGVGAGNLPNITTYCLAHDKTDNIWIGTADGIGVVYNASSCIDQRCDAEIPIVQYDQFAGYLFKGESVRAIAVDGANRKWIGTLNGVWLLSPDAGNSSIIYRFTKDNSPLPSNVIQKITVDKVTGDVYIGTDNGLVCYRSTATDGGETNSNVLTFPNPVPSGYKGTIAIKGLVANADVRITDINGQLVYRTTALGGQAVWNGMDYQGHRPQSGVYLIFASNADGSQTYAGKMVLLQ